jgi:hypothetical protein
LSREKTPPCSKKIHFLIDSWRIPKKPGLINRFFAQAMIFAAFDPKLKSRLFRNPPTLYRPQRSAVFCPFRARYFFNIGSQSFSDPHQSLSEA